MGWSIEPPPSVSSRQIGSEGKEFHLYAGLFHEIFNETEKDRVFADLEHWLDARVGGQIAATG